MKAVLVAMLMIVAAPAWASTGGPTLARVLGWDPREQKVFAAITYFDESAVPEEIVYFDLNRPPPGKPIIVRWSLDRANRDTRLAALRRRLEPLMPSLVQAMPSTTTIIGVDSIGDADKRARFRLRIAAPGFYRLELTAYRRPIAFIASLWSIPGREEKLAVVSHLGPDLENDGYEVQVPVLLPRASDELLLVEPIPHP